MARGKSIKSSNNSASLGFEAKLWLAADKLRSNMDAAGYKHTVLGLIFLRYISDSFEEKHAQLTKEPGVDDAMVAIERDNARLKGVLPKDYARPGLDKHRLGELIDLIGTIVLVDRAPTSDPGSARDSRVVIGDPADQPSRRISHSSFLSRQRYVATIERRTEDGRVGLDPAMDDRSQPQDRFFRHR